MGSSALPPQANDAAACGQREAWRAAPTTRPREGGRRARAGRPAEAVKLLELSHFQSEAPAAAQPKHALDTNKAQAEKACATSEEGSSAGGEGEGNGSGGVGGVDSGGGDSAGVDGGGHGGGGGSGGIGGNAGGGGKVSGGLVDPRLVDLHHAVDDQMLAGDCQLLLANS